MKKSTSAVMRTAEGGGINHPRLKRKNMKEKSIKIETGEVCRADTPGKMAGREAIKKNRGLQDGSLMSDKGRSRH